MDGQKGVDHQSYESLSLICVFLHFFLLRRVTCGQRGRNHGHHADHGVYHADRGSYHVDHGEGHADHGETHADHGSYHAYHGEDHAGHGETHADHDYHDDHGYYSPCFYKI